jgi:hypothetical protein
MKARRSAGIALVLSATAWLANGCFARDARAQDGRCDAALSLRAQGHLVAAREAVCPEGLCRTHEQSGCIATLLSALDNELPSLNFDLADAAGRWLPGVTIVVDNQRVPNERSAFVSLDPQPHTLFIRVDGYAPIEKVISLNVGEHARVLVRELLPITSPSGAESQETLWPKRKTVGIALGGLGIVGLATGVFFLTQMNQGCQSSQCSSPSLVRDALNRGIMDRDVAIASFGVAAALLTSASILLLFPPGDKTTGAVRFAPTVSSSGAGFAAAAVW